MPFDWAKGPSAHVTWRELACKDGTPYPEEWKVSRAIALAELFEVIRELCGNKPIHILSAYRTVDYNKSIGGVRNSQHIQGRALDLKNPTHIPIMDFYNNINSLTSTTLLRGIGSYETFIHVDIRPTVHVARW